MSEGSLVDRWGAGYFIALDLSSNDFTGLTSVEVGMKPSETSGLVEIIDDPDKNGIFKVTNRLNQKFVVKQTDGTHTLTQDFDLSNITLVNS